MDGSDSYADLPDQSLDLSAGSEGIPPSGQALCSTCGNTFGALAVEKKLFEIQGDNVTFGNGIGPLTNGPLTFHPSEPGVKSYMMS
jgi:hypothetical protein